MSTQTACSFDTLIEQCSEDEVRGGDTSNDSLARRDACDRCSIDSRDAARRSLRFWLTSSGTGFTAMRCG